MVPVLAAKAKAMIVEVVRRFCRDMTRFGGPGRKKKCCEKRTCLNPYISEVRTNQECAITE